MIGVIAGSGFYSLMEKFDEAKVETPYGMPSAKIALGKIAGKKVAFLARHGRDHQFPPHKINYRANIFALVSLGAEQILSVTACGSLQQKIKRGDFVVIDQFIDRTSGRKDTFYDGPVATHISSAYPFCRQISKLAFLCGKKLGMRIHKKGTVVVIQGPRFSTKAESEWFSQMAGDVINMTSYPEAVLAREMAVCYAAVGLVTDYDAGIQAKNQKIEPVTAEEVKKIFKENNEKARQLVYKMIENWPKKRTCGCHRALEGAVI